jgi:hypothetical protein
MALAGTRGIANAAVAEAASAAAIKPALINRFIGISSNRAARRLTQVPEPSFVPIPSLATRPSKNLGDLPKANRNCRFFPIRLPLRELFLPNADY